MDFEVTRKSIWTTAHDKISVITADYVASDQPTYVTTFCLASFFYVYPELFINFHCLLLVCVLVLATVQVYYCHDARAPCEDLQLPGLARSGYACHISLS